MKRVTIQNLINAFSLVGMRNIQVNIQDEVSYTISEKDSEIKITGFKSMKDFFNYYFEYDCKERIVREYTIRETDDGYILNIFY